MVINMGHFSYKDWLEVYEVELWKDYWEEMEDIAKDDRPPFLEWAEDVWHSDGAYGGGS